MSAPTPLGRASPRVARRVCDHPDLRPTRWDQPRPAPAEMTGCACGMNQHCPVCGYGHGSLVCDCNRAFIVDQTRALYG